MAAEVAYIFDKVRSCHCLFRDQCILTMLSLLQKRGSTTHESEMQCFKFVFATRHCRLLSPLTEEISTGKPRLSTMAQHTSEFKASDLAMKRRIKTQIIQHSD